MLIDKIRELEKERLAALIAMNEEIKASGTADGEARTDDGVWLVHELSVIEDKMKKDFVEMAQALIAVDDVLKQLKPDPFAGHFCMRIRKAIESTEKSHD